MKKFTFSCIVLTTWLAVIASLFVMPNTSYAQRISNRGVAIQDSGSLEGSNKRILNFSTDLAVDCTTPTAGCTVSSTAGGGGSTAVWGMLYDNTSGGSSATKFTGWQLADDDGGGCVTASATSDTLVIDSADTACDGVYLINLSGSASGGRGDTGTTQLRAGTAGTPAVVQTLSHDIGRQASDTSYAGNYVVVVTTADYTVQVSNSGLTPIADSMILSVVRIGS